MHRLSNILRPVRVWVSRQPTVLELRISILREGYRSVRATTAIALSLHGSVEKRPLHAAPCLRQYTEVDTQGYAGRRAIRTFL